MKKTEKELEDWTYITRREGLIAEAVRNVTRPDGRIPSTAFLDEVDRLYDERHRPKEADDRRRFKQVIRDRYSVTAPEPCPYPAARPSLVIVNGVPRMIMQSVKSGPVGA